MRADVVINIRAVATPDIGVNMLFNAEIIVVAAAAVSLDLTIKVLYVVEVLAGVMISGTPDIGAEVNASRAAVMTVLEFELLSSLEEPSLCF